MVTSTNGHAVMHYFERCKLQAYPDPGTGADPWTIGWGDTGPDVVPGLCITRAEADRRFAARLADEFEPCVLKAMRKRVPDQGQFDAFVCLAYNIGCTAFANSTMVHMFNMLHPGVENQFRRWDRSGGSSMLGLRRRRAAERALYLGSSGAKAILIGASAR